ncbi:MAG: hypothetical protein M1505_00865 [Patescibacteria group bacterium]|nr:hypothetical protein [Patescibacteria group bacterium]
MFRFGKKVSIGAVLMTLAILVLSANLIQIWQKLNISNFKTIRPNGIGVATATVSSISLTPTSSISNLKQSQPKILISPSKITLDNDGTIVEMTPGQSFLLALNQKPTDMSVSWNVDIANSDIISQKTNILITKDSQGVYEAKAIGTTTLTAVNSYPCQKTKSPCFLPNRIFRVIIVVSKN